jgi:cobalt/nickel transport system permease protein
MHSLLDDYAHSNALRDVSPRLKLTIGLGSILLCISSTSPLAPLLVATVMSLVIIVLAKIPGRFYVRLLLVPFSFAFLSSAVVAFMHGTGDQIFAVNLLGLNLAINTEGANLALLLVARTFGGMCSLFFIALTTPMIEIFSVLKSLRVPDILLELSMMIYRYIFVFLDQAVMIHTAQVMRLGDSGTKVSFNSFSMLSSVLFLRAWEQGERLMVAMDSRCYDGKLDLIEQHSRTSSRALLAALTYISAIAAVVILTRDIRLL